MGTILSEKVLIANEDHHDNGGDFIGNDLDSIIDLGLLFSELRSIASLKANNWKIKKGQKYIRQANVFLW